MLKLILAFDTFIHRNLQFDFLAAVFVVFSLTPRHAITPVDPHGGGLDAYGCYHNRKAGGYAIAVYSPGNPSQEEILKNFRQRRVMERPKRMRRNKLKFPTPKELQEILKRLTSEVANEPIATDRPS
jgi:hypothetical protein